MSNPTAISHVAIANHESGLEVLRELGAPPDDARGNWPTLRQENAAFRKFIQNIADGFDCDSDGHKYGTYCRSCDAKNLLEQYPA